MSDEVDHYDHQISCFVWTSLEERIRLAKWGRPERIWSLISHENNISKLLTCVFHITFLANIESLSGSSTWTVPSTWRCYDPTCSTPAFVGRSGMIGIVGRSQIIGLFELRSSNLATNSLPGWSPDISVAFPHELEKSISIFSNCYTSRIQRWHYPLKTTGFGFYWWLFLGWWTKFDFVWALHLSRSSEGHGDKFSNTHVRLRISLIEDITK